MRGFGFMFVLAALALLSSWFLWRVERSLEQQQAASSEPVLTISGLRAVALNNTGLPAYILTAPYAERLAGELGSRLQQPELESFLEDRRPAWLVRAANGWLRHDGEQLRLYGGVSAERWTAAEPTAPPLTLTTPELTVWPQLRRVENAHPVRLDSNGNHLQGVGLRGHLDHRSLELLNDVKVYYSPPG